jgi:hypothetical protein
VIDLAEAVRAELARACAHLLDEGLAPMVATRSASGAGGPIGHALRAARTLQQLVPRGLDTIDRAPSAADEVSVYRRFAKNGRPTRAPHEYAVQHTGGATRLLPTVWRASEPLLEPSRELLAWLLHGIDRLIDTLGRQRALLTDQLSEADLFRSGSRFGELDQALLRAQNKELIAAEDGARQLRNQITSMANRSLAPRSLLPRPFPRIRVWTTIRRLLGELEDPRTALPEIARDLLWSEPRAVDLPYLYQRWCGWRLVQALGALGYQPVGDPIPALLFSGTIDFRGPAPAVELLCDPRITAGKNPIRGLRSPVAEFTPDFVLIARHPDGVRTFVLDPTLSTDLEAVARRKAKYLHGIETGQRMVAGVRVVSRVDRSWGASPTNGTMCHVDLEDWRGTRGVVPMDPRRFESAPLEAWLGDLVR